MGEHIIVSKQKNKDNLSLPAFSISNKNGFIPQEEQFGKDNTYSKTDKSSNYIVKPKYFAYNPARINVGSIAYQNTITPVLVSSLYEIFRSDNNIDDVFLQYWFRSEYFYKQIQRLQEGGVRQYFFIDKMRESQIYLTNVSEQNKIGSIISKLDKLLTLQQRKLRQLKLLKNALLKRMFTAKKSPTLRFRDFSKDWKLHKLQDITDRLDNARVPVTASKRIAGSTPYYGANGIQDYVKGYTHDGEFLLVAEDGANNINDYPVICAKGKIWVNNHAHVLQAKNKKIDILFLMYALKFLNMKKYLVGGGRSKLNAETMMKLALKLPELDEEHNIGVLIKNMDVLITQYKYRIQKINKFKQFLLQNMFI
ncbi:restriction endonuclease subunit S [Lactobacillus johnsonii]|uniref:restriction endonuclease subunit S n=1 Tax=Lactobacillus johnsonii TaxID=33959 RepID=UPI0013039164|nr:restriction endonuclease subunit S [Lactobacillus johnsonii]QGY96640.1 restriction endonuclease subunit S [Lactobacillus johnsonii]